MKGEKPLAENRENKTNEIAHDLIPDNTFTIILKAKGKVYSLGGQIGKLSAETPDEDLNSTLRAVHGAGVTLQRTVAMVVAGRDGEYPLPGAHPSIEENLAHIEHTATLYVAGEKLEPGQPVHLEKDGKVYGLKKPEAKKEEE
jgi:hypothetical protein